MDTNIKIDDYGLFDDALNNIQSMRNSLKLEFDEITNEFNKINENVFLSPIYDTCSQGFSKITSEFNSSMDFYEIKQKKINIVSDNYKEADKDNEEKVVSVQ